MNELERDLHAVQFLSKTIEKQSNKFLIFQNILPIFFKVVGFLKHHGNERIRTRSARSLNFRSQLQKLTKLD